MAQMCVQGHLTGLCRLFAAQLCPGEQAGGGLPGHVLCCGVCFCPGKEALLCLVSLKAQIWTGIPLPTFMHKSICMYVTHFCICFSDVRRPHLKDLLICEQGALLVCFGLYMGVVLRHSSASVDFGQKQRSA